MVGKARQSVGPNTRYVRTAEGSDFYGLPINAPITPDAISKVNREAATIGIAPPKDALVDAAGKSVKAPAVVRPSIKVGQSDSTGPNTFKIGSASYGGPAGSRLIQPKNQPGVRYLIEPDGTIRAFNKDGEAEVPASLATVLEGRISDTSRYEELPFDSEGSTVSDPAEGTVRSESAGPIGSNGESITGKSKTGTVAGIEKITDRMDPERFGYRVDFDDNRSFTTGFDSPASASITDDIVGKDVTFDVDDMGWLTDLNVDDSQSSTPDADPEEPDPEEPDLAAPGDPVPAAPGQSITDPAQFDVLPNGTRVTINSKDWTRDGDSWDGGGGESIAHQYLARLIGREGQDIQLREEKNWRDLRTGDGATADFVTQSPAGAKFAFSVETSNGIVTSHRITEWTKQDDGSWESTSGNKISAEDAVKALDDETTLVVSTGVSNPVDDSLYPGGKSFPKEQVQAAYDGLLAHSGFQVFYGLPKDNPLRDRELVGALTTAARAEYPDLSPKQAVLAYMRGKLGISADTATQPGSASASQITIGVSGEGRKRVGVQGVNGGDFSVEDVRGAISILESFNGKAFKSELNKQGNPLGTLDPTSLVGIEKDKTVGKQKFIDYLKNALSGANSDEVEETYEFPELTDISPIAGSGKLPGQQPTGDWMRTAAPGSAMYVSSRGGGEGAAVQVKYRDGIWRSESGAALPEWVLTKDEWSFRDQILRNGDGVTEPEQPTVRAPEELVGQSPETRAELAGLPVGTTFTMMGKPWIKQQDGTYSELNPVEPNSGISERKMAGALRGIIITSVTTLPEEPLESFGGYSRLRVGETIGLRRSSLSPDTSAGFGVIQTWARVPDQDGQKMWARADGSLTHGDNVPEEMFYAEQAFADPEGLTWFARRDSAAPEDAEPTPAPTPDAAPEPTPDAAPEPTPDAPTSSYAVGEAVVGKAMLESLPNGTRLAYVRKKDARETSYTTRDGLLVTDRGTEVSFDRAERMQFRIVSIPESTAPAPEPTPDVPEQEPDERGESINGSYVGDRVRSSADFEAAPLGSRFWIGNEDNTFSKISEELWISNRTDFRYESEYFAKEYRHATWADIPTPEESAQTPWFSPADDPNWVMPDVEIGMVISRTNFKDTLNGMVTGTTLTAVLESGVEVEYTKREDGAWDVINHRSGSTASQSTPVMIEITANYGRATFTVSSLPSTGTTSAGEVSEESLLRAPAGTVVRVAGISGKPYVLAVRTEGGAWDTDSRSTPSIMSSTLIGYFRNGRVTQAEAGDQPVLDFHVGQDDIDSLPVGSVIDIRKMHRYTKTEDGWKDHRTGAIHSPDSVRQSIGRSATSRGGDSSTILLTNGVSRNAGVDLEEGMTLSPFEDLPLLPVGSRVSNGIDRIFTLQEEGKWIPDGYSVGSPWDPERVAVDSPDSLILTRKGWSPLTDLPEVGAELSFEEVQRLPEGSKFTVDGDKSFTLLIPNGDYVVTAPNLAAPDGNNDGEVTQSFSALSGLMGSPRNYSSVVPPNRTFTYTGVDTGMADGTVTLGQKVRTAGQLESLPEGAYLTGSSGIAVVKINSTTFAVALDGTAGRLKPATYTSQNLLSALGSIPTYESDVTPAGFIRRDSPDLDKVPEGSIVTLQNDLTQAWTKTPEGWTASGARSDPMTTEKLRESLIGVGAMHYIPGNKATKVGKYFTAPEVAALREGTLAYIRLPGASSKLRTGRYRFTGSQWDSIDGKGAHLSREFVIAAGARGHVKVEAMPVYLDLKSQTYSEALAQTKSFVEATDVARAAVPGANWVDLAMPSSLSASERDDLQDQYVEYLDSMIRNLKAYPILEGLGSFRGNRENRLGAFAYVRHPIMMDNMNMESSLRHSNMTVNMRYGKREMTTKNEFAATTNHFHGVARPGITFGDRTVTHEMGHAIDVAAQMKLGAEATRLRNEYIRDNPGEFTKAVITESMSNYTRVGEHKAAELWAETFENWTNNTEVEPITEYMVQGVLTKFREITGLNDFEFVKNLGSEGAAPNANPLLPSSLNAVHPASGSKLTSSQIAKLPAGSSTKRDNQIWEKRDNGSGSPWISSDGENLGYYQFIAGNPEITLVSVGTGIRGDFNNISTPREYFEFELAPVGTKIIVGVGDAESLTKSADGMWETPTGAKVTNWAAYFGVKDQTKGGRPVRYGHSNKPVIWFSETNNEALRDYGAGKALEEAPEGSKLSVPASATLPSEDRFIKVGGTWQSMLMTSDTYTNARLASVVNSQAGSRLKLLSREVSNPDGTPYKSATESN